MAWKETVTDFSANIFPDLYTIDVINTSNVFEPNPSMRLQMFMFFNVFLFPFWLITSIVFLSMKYYYLGTLMRFLVVSVLIMISIIECIRLYLGYLGNLSERIPELAGFWMLSILLQLPLQTFLLANPYLNPRPIEITLNAFMWLLLVAQLATGFFALKAAAARAKQFYALKAHLRKLAKSDKSKNE